jgi:hypothetical protein
VEGVRGYTRLIAISLGPILPIAKMPYTMVAFAQLTLIG